MANIPLPWPSRARRHHWSACARRARWSSAAISRTYTAPDIPAWLITDQNYRNRYLFRDVLPALPFPDAWYQSGAVFTAWSIEDLATKIGVPPAALRTSVNRFNGFAFSGVDTDQSRGRSAYDHYFTDPAVFPNSCLASLWEAPFYAFKIVPGDLGTKGGLLTDADARVIDTNGNPVEGLYAAGNTTASVMGRTYPGPVTS